METTENLPRILIVDDIHENLFALRQILQNLPVEILEASSGNEALTLTLTQELALIILDVQMPEMDGYEVAEILKGNDETENIPIIFVTAIDRNDAKEIKGYDTGAIDFIFKPINKYILISKVKIFVEMYQNRRNLEQIVNERTRSLEETKAFLNAVINSIPSILIYVDSMKKITGMNREAENFLSSAREQISGTSILTALRHFSSYLKDLDDTIKNKKIHTFEKIIISMENDTEYYNLAMYPLDSSGIDGAVVRIDRITERVHLEQMLIQSEKMLSIGGLAAGMAHEINNPLGGIIQSTQVLKRRLFDNIPKNREAAENAGITMENIVQYMDQRGVGKIIESELNAGEKASKIVNNMLSFARKDDDTFTQEDILQLIDKTLLMASGTYNFKKGYDFRKITIVREYGDNIPLIPCSSSKFQQVLFNIFQNGAEAMSSANIKKPVFHISVQKEQESVLIEISDNGPGMNDKCRKRIFEPFFTTKPVGVGTGLGLSVSYFIITEDHKGKMSVKSEPDRGTIFTIKLPLNLERGISADHRGRTTPDHLTI